MGLGPNFQITLIFLFFELSESTAPLFPQPGDAGSDGGGPRSIWPSRVLKRRFGGEGLKSNCGGFNRL